MTVRVAATGRAASPPLFETLAVLGKETCRRRLRAGAPSVAEGDRSRACEHEHRHDPAGRASASGPTSSARSSPRTCGAGKHATVVTRFPPEPNGYLHIGHAKSICLNFGIAREFGGRCHLRFDDTNPTKEEQEYIDAIEADVRWLGFDWGEHLYYASDYFEQLYDVGGAPGPGGQGLRRRPDGRRDPRAPRHADRAGHGTARTATARSRRTSTSSRACARASSPTARACCARRSTWPRATSTCATRCSTASCTRRTRAPATPGASTRCTTSPTASRDAIEGITHSICTLEFEDHRPLYDWFIENLPVPSRPRQNEFARLNLTYTVLSKRILLKLVNDGRVRGWDDPRMPTISGMRRRGFPPEAHPRLRGADRRRQARQHRRRARCSSTACATCSTATRRAASRCCARSRS